MLNGTWVELIEELAEIVVAEYCRHKGRELVDSVPVFDIAERLLDLKCDIEPLNGTLERISALVLPSKRWVIINENQGLSRIRFSLAHEIAHWLIESRQNAEFSRFGSLDLSFFRTSRGRERERIADYFAGALLMPRSFLLLLQTPKMDIDENRLRELAARLEVSPLALQIRLAQLAEATPRRGPSQRNIGEPEAYAPQQKPSPQTHLSKLIVYPSSIIDHRFTRVLASESGKDADQIYVGLLEGHHHLAVSMSELRRVSGIAFLSYREPAAEELKVVFGRVREVDLRHHAQYYDRVATHGVDSNPVTVAYTRDSGHLLQYNLLEIRSLSQRISPRVRLNNRQGASQFIREQKSEGKKVVIVTGCFDIITEAHVRFLRTARNQGDVLVVGVESDARIRYFKRDAFGVRPVNTEAQRAEVLNEFRCVDYVFIIHGSITPDTTAFYTRLHRDLRADILAVTEDDLHLEDRRQEIEDSGGRIVIISKLPSISTTTTLQKALSQNGVTGISIVPARYVFEGHRIERNTSVQLRLPI